MKEPSLEIPNPRIGTCSWKFESWVGLVYSAPRGTAAEYLREYSGRFETAEIDSWFYRMPSRRTVIDYLGHAGESLRFTCKLPMAISLTHHRKKPGERALRRNPDFLSGDLFKEFLEAVQPMAGRLDAVMLEFEYLNKKKMPSLNQFLASLERFLPHVPDGVPLAIETRNKNHIQKEYFQFLRENGLMHVFSEKIYMPHVYEVYERHGDLIEGGTVIRLLGGDRKNMEEKTGGEWNTIVEPRSDLKQMAVMARNIVERGMALTINVNNHYEGSAPMTIRRLRDLLEAG